MRLRSRHGGVEEVLSRLALGGALILEGVACAIVFIGALVAAYRLIPLLVRDRTIVQKRAVYSQFGFWLVIGLEFELAADIIRSAITPNWTDIAQLAAIAAIRTFLNYFLMRDVEQTAVEPEP